MAVSMFSKMYEQIPHSSDNKAWWHYVDDSVTPELLNGEYWNNNKCISYFILFLGLAHEFVEIYESCPSRFRAKIDSKQQVNLLLISSYIVYGLL